MDHIRIDEGMRRGPRKKPGPKPSSPRRNNGQLVPVLPNDPESIAKALQDYCNGATLKELGERWGVTRQAVYGWLLGELGGEQHHALVTRALTARVAKGDETLDTADNPLDLARGREQARNARLDLERRRASLYGQKQELTLEDKREAWPELLARLHREHMAKLAASQPTGVQVQQLIEHAPITPVDKPDTA